MVFRNMPLQRWLELALGVSVLLNCVLLTLWLGLATHPAVPLPVPKPRSDPDAPRPGGGLDKPPRIVTEGLPGGIRAVLRGHRGLIEHCAYSPDGSLLVAATDSGYLSIWSCSGTTIQLVADHGPESLGIGGGYRGNWALAFAPDGRSLAYSCFGQEQHRYEIHVLDLIPGLRREIRFDEPVAKKGRIPHAVCTGLAFSPDGKILAAGSQNGIDLYDALTGRSQGFLSIDKHFFYSHLAYPPGDSTRLVSSSLPWEIQVFDLGPRRRLRAFGSPEMVSGQRFDRPGPQSVESLILSSDGTRLAVSTTPNCAFLWNFQQGELIAAIQEGTGSGWSEGRCRIGFTPDGRSLLTASRGLKQLDRVFARRRETESGELLYQVELVQPGEPLPDVYPAAFSPDGRSLVCKGAVGWDRVDTLPESILAIYDLGGLYGEAGPPERQVR